MMGAKQWIGICSCGLILVGCSTNVVPPKESTSTTDKIYSGKSTHKPKLTEPLSANQVEQAGMVAAANDEFALRLASALGLPKSSENYFFSPFSVSTLLAALLNGTTGPTHAGLRKVLFLGDKPIENINVGYQALDHLMATDPKWFKVANSIWFVDSIKPTNGFTETVNTYYNAEVRKLGSRGIGAPAIINRWAREKTDGRIDQLIDDVSDASVILVNALSFTGEWIKPFDPALTQKAPFDSANERVEAMMMRHAKEGSPLEEFTYTETDLYQTVLLHYKNNGYSMAVILPCKDKTVADLWQHLTYENWKKMLSNLGSRLGTVQLPKWNFKDALQLERSLQQLGAEAAFKPSGDFTPISYELSAANISKAIQKTMIEVDEKGTKAAVSTMAEVKKEVAHPTVDKPFEFIANKAFIYAILGGPNRTIVFLGVCNRP